ncbi:MAG: hypothetical protein QGH59_09380, partial [Gemmatimonadota bacterium]|nr:hypothetical protein [Gemmatimonadota bacterium]
MTNFTSRATGPLCALVLLCAAILPAAAANFDSMVLLSRLDDYSAYNDVWGFVGNDGREYMIQGLTTGTAWWDIEDPVHPVFVRMIGGPSSTWRDMFVIGDHCYISPEGGGGIQIVDISDPTNPTLVNTYTDTVGSLHNIFGDPARNLIFGIGGYSNGANGGIQI